MGSQETWNHRLEAPAAIVVRCREKGRLCWRIALRGDGWQPDREGGGRGPVVVTYSYTVGRPYRSEQRAATDAALILARQLDGL